MQYLLWGLGFIVLITVINRVTAVLALRRLRLRAPRFRMADAAEVPEALRGELAAACERLAPGGFSAAGWARGWSPDAGDQREQWFALASHFHGHWMLLCPHPLPEPGLPWMISFLSPLPGGRWLLTPVASRHLIYGELPQTILPPPGAPIVLNPDAAWEQHAAALAAHTRGAAPAGPEDFLARLARAWDGYPERLVASGLAGRVDAETVRPSVGGAWRSAVAVQKGAAALQRALAGRGGEPVPPAVEVEAVLRHDARRAGPAADGLRGLVMVAGAALFLAIFGSLFQHWWEAALLLGVLLVHEAGHLVAMRLCGYRDTAIFILPGLGAITTGEKRDASVAQQVLVSLAGPLPGLIAGLAMVIHGMQGEVARALAPMLIGLNLFNLLPLLPLDGGQIVHRLLLGRVPWLDAAARTLAVVVLAGIGIAEPMLLVLALFLGLGLPTVWAEAGFIGACLRDPELRRLDREGMLAALALRVAAHPRLSRRPCALRWATASGTRERLARVLPAPWALAGLLLAWLGALIVPLLILLVLAVIRHHPAAESAGDTPPAPSSEAF